MLTFFKPTEYLDHHLPSDRRLGPWQRPLSLLNFVTDRARKAGLRFILQLAACIFFVLACLRVVRWRLADGTVAVKSVGGIADSTSSYSNILAGHREGDADGQDLRIVVFGSQDVTGSAVRENKDAKTWTQHLCEELGCASLLSFVPHSNDRPGLTSKTAYSAELDKLGPKRKKNAPDYSFAQSQYPVPIGTPDLEAQVQQFLSMPVPKKAPKQTLWILSFGTWDIWNLAALPMDQGEDVVTMLVQHIFDQVGLLYKDSLNPDSIAFSNYFANMTDAEFEALTSPTSLFDQEPRSLESFRLLIPHLFDITMTPGWHNRPIPPSPHSTAEQMRNAAFLTERWNQEVTQKMYEWTELGRMEPKELRSAGKIGNSKETAQDGKGQQQVAEESPQEIQPPESSQSKNTLVAPYPFRLGHDPDPAEFLLNVMMEVDMGRSGLKDDTGRIQFEDIWTPCLGRGNSDLEELYARSDSQSVDDDQSAQDSDPRDRDVECDMPEDHLFYDLFTVGSRAIEEVAKWTAAEVKSKLLPP